jgi:hypothetical protein
MLIILTVRMQEAVVSYSCVSNTRETYITQINCFVHGIAGFIKRAERTGVRLDLAQPPVLCYIRLISITSDTARWKVQIGPRFD